MEPKKFDASADWAFLAPGILGIGFYFFVLAVFWIFMAFEPQPVQWTAIAIMIFMTLLGIAFIFLSKLVFKNRATILEDGTVLLASFGLKPKPGKDLVLNSFRFWTGEGSYLAVFFSASNVKSVKRVRENAESLRRFLVWPWSQERVETLFVSDARDYLRIDFKEPLKNNSAFTWKLANLEKIYFSLKDPERFVQELRRFNRSL
ncbi:MAG: hypothetical protein V1847_03555 [Candidatus Diapherotrites archaeon]